MICVTVAPESRTLAKADLLNAAGQGDIVELCLDRLIKEPDVGDLLAGFDQPIIVSCRAKEDGGNFQGDEEARRAILKQAILANPAYVELDIEMARKVPRFGETQRVISFTRLDRPEFDVESLYAAALSVQADVVKFTWPTRNLDETWPLLAAVTKKRQIPFVGMGLGEAGLTFSLLGLKYGSPWVYAALEKGLESYPGQPGVFELREAYRSTEVNRKTRFIAVAGFGDTGRETARAINSAFATEESSKRCLPIKIGNPESLAKRLDTLEVKILLAAGNSAEAARELADSVDERDRKADYLDLIVKNDGTWNGFNTIRRAARKALERSLSGSTKDGGLERLQVVVLGNSSKAQALAAAFAEKASAVSVCGPDDKLSQQIAESADCRFVPYQNLYNVLADVVMIADPDLEIGQSHQRINPSFLQPSMTVVDVAEPPAEHALFVEATERGCRLVSSSEVLREQLRIQFKVISGKEIDDSALELLAAGT